MSARATSGGGQPGRGGWPGVEHSPLSESPGPCTTRGGIYLVKGRNMYVKERPIFSRGGGLTKDGSFNPLSKFACTDKRLEPQPTLGPHSEAGVVAEIITQSCR